MHLPRVAGLFLWVILGSAFYLLLPWLLSKLLDEYGWRSNSPSLWNLLGILPAIGGAALVV